MATTIFTSPKNDDRLAQLWEDLLNDPVPPHPLAKAWRTVGARFERSREPVLLAETEQPRSMSRRWRVDFVKLFHSLLETVEVESASPNEVIAEDAFSELSLEAAHEASLALASPFHWEPKPAWISAPVSSNPPFARITDPHQFAPRPKIPLRPLHKQPFYRRFFFYLRGWLSRRRTGL